MNISIPIVLKLVPLKAICAFWMICNVTNNIVTMKGTMPGDLQIYVFS
jgi:hypothetical protein